MYLSWAQILIMRKKKAQMIQVRNICFFSSRSLKTREKYISFVQLVLLSFYFFEGSVFTFQFLNDRMHNYVKNTITTDQN